MLSLSFAQDSDLGWYTSFVTMRELSVADSKDTDWAATTGVGLLKVNIMFFRLFLGFRGESAYGIKNSEIE